MYKHIFRNLRNFFEQNTGYLYNIKKYILGPPESFSGPILPIFSLSETRSQNIKIVENRFLIDALVFSGSWF